MNELEDALVAKHKPAKDEGRLWLELEALR